jgi:putative selenium metabolism hydrolase
MSFSMPINQRVELIDLARSLVTIQSYSGREEPAIRLAEKTMQALGFQDVLVDSLGNVSGRLGTGDQIVLLDAHLDTVAVEDAEQWTYPPFEGRIVDGVLHGRGSVDMKSAAAAAMYGATIAHQKGWTEGKSVYVSCTVFEEDCDGENLRHLFADRSLHPDAVVICEPSNNQIALGHKGKAQVIITTEGVSAHGADPDRGVNAVYEMAEIIQRVARTHAEIEPIDGLCGSMVLSDISSRAASLNAVPSRCQIYIDRRTVPGESEERVRSEMDALVFGKKASWTLDRMQRTAWTGKTFEYEPLHEAWKIDLDHPLVEASQGAFRACFDRAPQEYVFWDFSTNAVTPVRLGIPTIGFGPGDFRLAHMRDECIPLQAIVEACGFYSHLIRGWS